ncbi:unnamed protein product [Thelazia callipaeda]|uniref:ShKT domain-containing protein n=1 Tax=Thelazia callipaeda TaxID=103827 RepID=A0A0N5CTZ7_THECL|nr:unnamed protein product [Thelazia callipaeda]
MITFCSETCGFCDRPRMVSLFLIKSNFLLFEYVTSIKL